MKWTHTVPRVISDNMGSAGFDDRVVEVFHKLKYSFNSDFEHGIGVIRPSMTYGALARGTAWAAGGLIAALGTGSPRFTDEEVKAAVDVLGKLGDLVGLRLDTGGALLALFVIADDLPCEALIGKSVLIRDELKVFKRFVMKMAWVKRGVIADTFFVFHDSSKAFQFRQNIQGHCKHGEFWGKTYVLPWGIDTAARAVWGYKGWPPPGYMSGLKRDEIERLLFGNS